MSNSSEILSGLALQLSQLAMSSYSDAEKNDAAIVIGQKVLDAARGPMPDWMDRAIHAMDFVSLKLFLDWKAFDMIPLDGSISHTHLAEKLEADVSLISESSSGVSFLIPVMGADNISRASFLGSHILRDLDTDWRRQSCAQ